MKRISKIDKNVAIRWQELGNLGEYLSEILLKQAKFKNIRNLNKDRSNNPYADIYAERNNEKYVISVKTRNKYENNGRLNSRYKLNTNCYELAKLSEKSFNAKAAWLTIAVDIDNGTFEAYFGLLSSLRGNTGVLMTSEATEGYECLAFYMKLRDLGISKNESKRLKNVYERIKS